MSFTRLKATFLRLPREMKFVGIGSFFLAISTLLPWYADLDSYRIGDEFLGVTGPASFVGIAVLALAGFSLWIFSYHLMERRVPRLPVREGIFHLFVAIESLFLLLIVNSIYFHPKFGVNITLKESRFGMTLAVISALVLCAGGFLKNKKEIAENEETGKLEPLIKMEEVAPQPQSGGRMHAGLPSSQSQSLPSRPVTPVRREIPRSFQFGEVGRAEKVEKKEETGGGSFKIRMDL